VPNAIDGLDQAQARAVTHRGGPLLVLGAPGTGKTEVVVRRLRWLVEQGTRPDGVIAVARSPRVAAGIRADLEAAITEPYEDLWVFTPEGLGERLLREHAVEAGLDATVAIVTRADRLALLLDRIDDLTLRRHEIRGSPGPVLAGVIGRIDRLKAAGIAPDRFAGYAGELAAAAAAGGDADRVRADRELEFAGLYADHERLLAAAGVLDSGELVLRASRLLHERPHVRRELAERFGHVLLDEWDTLPFAAGVLVRLLATDRGQLTAASDVPAGAADPAAAFRHEFPNGTVVRLTRSHRSPRAIMEAAAAVVAPAARNGEVAPAGPPPRNGEVAPAERNGAQDGVPRRPPPSNRGRVRFWRCTTGRAQAQAVAGEIDRLLTGGGVAPSRIGLVMHSLEEHGPELSQALEERAVPFRAVGGTALFRRAEVRDVLAWLRLLADPGDARAVVRALSRPPIELRSVDLARLTQHARRRKLDMVAGVAAACHGPQLSPEGRERAEAFLKLHRSASSAFDDLPPDAFVHRLVERIGVRRRQLFVAQPEAVERLRALARLGDLATSYTRREPEASARDFARYAAAVAEAGLSEDDLVAEDLGETVRIAPMDAVRGLEFDWVFVLGLEARPPAEGRSGGDVPPELRRGEHAATSDPARTALRLAMTRARRGLVLSWAATSPAGRPSSALETAKTALGADEELFEEQLFGPGEGLHSTFRLLRDDVLDTVSRVGGRLGEMRLDTYMDVSEAVARHLELIKVAALIDRTRRGESVDQALAEVNELLLQDASPAQRELFEASALDGYLRDTERDERRRVAALSDRSEPSLESFIPRRGDGLMLSASDIETYRLCPLKYKFARVFRIPQEPTINQRFGIVVHQVLERFHVHGGGSLGTLMELFETSWRRSGFGDANDDLQFRAKAVTALERYWQLDRESEGEPVSFERPFTFRLGRHLVRGRVDRVDRLPGGGHELMDYKTGAPKSADELRDDVQLSLYQMGARSSWGLETSGGSYYYVLDNERVPVSHTEEELERVRTTVGRVADGILAQDFEPTPAQPLCSFCDYRIICPAAET